MVWNQSPEVRELRQIAKIDDFVRLGKQQQIEWLLNVLSALRHPSCRQILKLPLDATDGELLRALGRYQDKQKLLKKGNCDLASAIQVESALLALTRMPTKSAWDREAILSTGKLERLSWTPDICRRYWLSITVAFIMGLAFCLLCLAIWMKLTRTWLPSPPWLSELGERWWAWPHGFISSAVLAVIALSVGAIGYCCRLCCPRQQQDNSGELLDQRSALSGVRAQANQFDIIIERDSSGQVGFTYEATTLCIDRIEQGRADLHKMKVGDKIISVNGIRVFTSDDYCAKAGVTKFQLTMRREELSPKPSLKAALTRTGSFASLQSRKPIEEEPLDEDEIRKELGLSEDTNLSLVAPTPDDYTLALAMKSSRNVQPERASLALSIPSSPGNDLAITPMASPSEKAVTFHSEVLATSGNAVVMQQEEQLYPDGPDGIHSNEAFTQTWPPPPTSLALVKTADLADVKTNDAPVYISGTMSALWHDPSYSFASRHASQTAKAAAEAAKDPAKTKMPPVTKDMVNSAHTHLSTMVIDQPTHGVEKEIRPHMQQFYLNTMFQSEPKYPDWHPGGKVKGNAEMQDCCTCGYVWDEECENFCAGCGIARPKSFGFAADKAQKRLPRMMKPILGPPKPNVLAEPMKGNYCSQCGRFFDDATLDRCKGCNASRPKFEAATLKSALKSGASSPMSTMRSDARTMSQSNGFSPSGPDRCVGLVHPSMFTEIEDAHRYALYSGGKRDDVFPVDLDPERMSELRQMETNESFTQNVEKQQSEPSNTERSSSTLRAAATSPFGRSPHAGSTVSLDTALKVKYTDHGII